MYKLKYSLVAAVSATALAISANMASAQQKDLHVGVMESLTGPVALAGTSNACGFRIAADMLASEGRPKDYKFVLHLEDDQSKPAAAVQAITKLTSEGITLFLGGTSTFTVMSVLPLFNDAGALYTGGVVKSDDLLKTDGHILRLNSSTAMDGAIIADYAANKLGAKKIAFVALQGAYADGALAAIKAALPEGSEISDTFILPVETSNFQPVLTSLASAKPDAVIYGIFGTTQSVALLRQYKQANLGIPLIATSGTLNISTTKAAAGAADGVASADIWSPGLENDVSNKVKQAFEQYKDAHAECKNVPLDKLIAISYGQIVLLADAIDKAGSIDPATLRKTIIEGSWDLPQGTVTFEPNGQGLSEQILVIGKGDDVVPLDK
jgi:branched-chain amino acid transport system substrate-binding protein